MQFRILLLALLGQCGNAIESAELTRAGLTSSNAQTPAQTLKKLSFLGADIVILDSSVCSVSTDCSQYPFYVCENKTCVHKSVFPQEGLEIAGLFTFGIIMALCTVAGIGGGGIANSMLIAFFKFETKPAVAISSFSILICTTFRFFYNFKTMHPEKPNMNVLDYGLASIMMPTTLAGSQVGGYILEIFPGLYIQILLTLLLAFLSY